MPNGEGNTVEKALDSYALRRFLWQIVLHAVRAYLTASIDDFQCTGSLHAYLTASIDDFIILHSVAQDGAEGRRGA